MKTPTRTHHRVRVDAPTNLPSTRVPPPSQRPHERKRIIAALVLLLTAGTAVDLAAIAHRALPDARQVDDSED